jgi:hypothetical protein
MPRELILLSPYTPPTNYPLSLGADETSAWLHAWSALWHPAAIAGAVGPPRVASPYDHEQPTAGHVYAVPESPPLYLSDDWDDRVRQAGAAAFRSGWDRASTLANLKEALGQLGADLGAFDRDAGELRPYFGLGLGYITVETLFDAMEHEHLLEKDAFWTDVQSGALPEAAMKLLHAREVVYPVAIHLLDFALPVEPDDALPAALGRRSPFNLIAGGELLAAMSPERLAELRAAATETIPDTDDPRLAAARRAVEGARAGFRRGPAAGSQGGDRPMAECGRATGRGVRPRAVAGRRAGDVFSSRPPPAPDDHERLGRGARPVAPRPPGPRLVRRLAGADGPLTCAGNVDHGAKIPAGQFGR